MSKPEGRRGLSPWSVLCTTNGCRAVIGSNVLDNHNNRCPFCGAAVERKRNA